MLLDTGRLQANIVRMSVCARPEEGSRNKAGRRTTRPRPPGLCSFSSADGEAAGQAEQAAEARFGPHQRHTGQATARTVSNLFTLTQVCEVSLHDSPICIISRRPVIERGCVDDSFYSQFNTCSR